MTTEMRGKRSPRDSKLGAQPPPGRLPEFVAREPRGIAIDRLRRNDVRWPLAFRAVEDGGLLPVGFGLRPSAMPYSR